MPRRYADAREGIRRLVRQVTREEERRGEVSTLVMVVAPAKVNDGIEGECTAFPETRSNVQLVTASSSTRTFHCLREENVQLAASDASSRTFSAGPPSMPLRNDS
jgi:hypothetical protein